MAPGRGTATPNPDNFPSYLDIVISAAERTRGILYFFGVIFCSTFVLFGEYAFFFDWPAKRHALISKAYNCYIAEVPPTPKDETVPPPSQRADDCTKALDYTDKWYKIPVYSDKAQGSNIKPLNPRAYATLFEQHKRLSKEYIDNYSTTIPFVGVRFDKNSGILLYNVLIICIFGVLYLSLKNEIRILDDIRGLLDDDHKKSMVRNCHIFAGPGKGLSIWYLLFLPTVVGAIELASDLRYYQIPVELLGTEDGWTYLLLEVSITMVLFFMSRLCFRAGTALEHRLIEL